MKRGSINARRYSQLAALMIGLLPIAKDAAAACNCECDDGTPASALNQVQCNNVCTKSGRGGGSCVHKPCCDTQESIATIYPRYEIVGIEYAAPGIGSEVEYSNATAFGSRIDFKASFKSGIKVETDGTISAETEDLMGASYGASFEFETASGRTLKTTSQIDDVHHEKDLILLWTNPSVTLDSSGKDVKVTLGTPGSVAPVIVPLTIEQLANPAKIGDSWIRSAIKTLGPDDYQSIMRADPFVGYDGTADPADFDSKRFTYKDEIQLDGPSDASNQILGRGYVENVSVLGGISAGGSFESEVAFGTDVGVDFLGLFGEKLKVSGKWQWELESSTEQTNGTETEATVTLQTTTLNYHNVFDVYYDNVFKTFLFRQLNPGAPTLRRATRMASKGAVPAVPKGSITVTLIGRPGGVARWPIELQSSSSGRVRHAITNSQGVVTLPYLPAGSYTIYFDSARKVGRPVKLSEGQAASITQRIGPSPVPSTAPRR